MRGRKILPNAASGGQVVGDAPGARLQPPPLLPPPPSTAVATGLTSTRTVETLPDTVPRASVQENLTVKSPGVSKTI